MDVFSFCDRVFAKGENSPWASTVRT